MDDKEINFTDVYSIYKADGNKHLCKILFNVRQFSSSKDNLYKTEIKIEHNLKDFSSTVEIFDFQVFNNKSKVCHITDFMLPPILRGCRIGMFILNSVYNYLLPEIKLSIPQVNGILIAKDSKPNRDWMYQRLIGYDVQHPLSIFNINADGDGYFKGPFLDVGNSWQQSITVLKEQ